MILGAIDADAARGPEPEGGDPPCRDGRACPTCGALTDAAPTSGCPICGRRPGSV